MSPFSAFGVLALTTLFFTADRASKLWAQVRLSENDIVLWQPWLRFELHYNENLALSIPFPSWAQIIVSVVLLYILLWYFFKKAPPQKWYGKLAIAMILAGALGNLFDRILFGKVTDFIALWQFPVWNIADMLLFCGIGFFLIQELFSPAKKEEPYEK